MSEALDSEPMARLLPQVRLRDEAASRQLVDRLYPLVSRIVRANLPRRSEPEYLIQEIFMKMFTKLDQFRHEVPFEHWVSRIAVTTCLDQLRRQKARPELRWGDLSEEDQQLMDSLAATETPVDADASQALEWLNRLLQSLSPDDAWLLRKVEMEQRPLAEVCAEMGWNRGLTRVRLFRARRRLQKEFSALENR
ncbi:MAG: RNA polymerase sigma factor [Verrucomicrobia bacterium]|nr:RNA polymerase sigma factor [Verrucomicrobiota bacterium]